MSLMELLRSDGSIVINKALIHGIGLNESILFCELLSRKNYFESKNLLDGDGYFYNTQYDLQAGTGLGEKAQRTAISKLKSLGLVECKLKGLPAKRYFKVIADDDLILKYIQKGKIILQTIANSQDTSQGGNLKLRGKELDTDERSANNTNINNTKEIILKNLNVVVANRNDASFWKSFFIYYLDTYKKYIGNEHPKLSTDLVEEIVNNMHKFAFDYDITTQDKWREIADIYFRSNLQSDRNMIHFSQEGILYNRADNLRLIK